MSSSRAFKLKQLHSSRLGAWRPFRANLFIAGVGAVGGTLIEQLNSLDSRRYDLEVIGFCNSTKVVWREKQVRKDELYGGSAKNWDQIIEKIKRYASSEVPVIFVDATGSMEVARLYLELLENGIHVVTPSKLSNTLEQEWFESLRNTAERNNVSYAYETTVGAGLPIIQTIENLIDSGDRIVSVEGVLSGTMTWLFSQLEQGLPFSRAVIEARTLGYAEPDPRDDLSGEDVARKFLILARTSGLKLEREDLKVESLIPEKLADVDASVFLSLLSDYDSEWAERLTSEKKKGKTLRYIGSLDEKGEIRIGMASVDLESELGRLDGTNNLVTIRTERYYDQPMVIKGPGAGKEVTAAGILADIQKILREARS